MEQITLSKPIVVTINGIILLRIAQGAILRKHDSGIVDVYKEFESGKTVIDTIGNINYKLGTEKFDHTIHRSRSVVAKLAWHRAHQK